jgi:hypothetical protein
VVCLVRSGCLLHLHHYAQLPGYATAPLPPPAAELNAAADIVKALPPVSKYKVVAVAYCQYPKPTPPPPVPQQQLETAGSAQLGQTDAAAAAAGAGAAVGGSVMQHGQGQQQQQRSQGVSKGSSKKSKSKSASAGWGLGYDDEEEDERSEGEDEESESNSEDDEFNDRNIRLTGIDSDADACGSKQQASQSLQQAGSHQQQQQGDGDAVGQGQAAIQQQQQMVVQQRPPCMWVLLSPVSIQGSSVPSEGQGKAAAAAQPAATPSPPPGIAEEDQLDDFFGDHLQVQVQQPQQQQKLPCLTVPLHIDTGLPDYLVQPGGYEAALQRRWLPQDRCSMFIGNRQVRELGGGTGYDLDRLINTTADLLHLLRRRLETCQCVWLVCCLRDGDGAQLHCCAPPYLCWSRQ